MEIGKARNMQNNIYNAHSHLHVLLYLGIAAISLASILVVIAYGAEFATKRLSNQVSTPVQFGFAYELQDKNQEALLLIEKMQQKSYAEAKDLSRKGAPVILWYWADTCPPCIAQASVLSELAAKFKGKVVFVRSANIEGSDLSDAERNDMANEDIIVTPAFIVFRNGQKTFKAFGLYAAINGVDKSNGNTKDGLEKLFSAALQGGN